MRDTDTLARLAGRRDPLPAPDSAAVVGSLHDSLATPIPADSLPGPGAPAPGPH